MSFGPPRWTRWKESATLVGIERRSTLFRALAMAEVTVISLSRGVQMLYRLEERFGLGACAAERFCPGFRRS